MQELIERQHFGTLQIREQSGNPEEEKSSTTPSQRNSKIDAAAFRRRRRSDLKRGGKQCHGQQNSAAHQEREQDRVAHPVTFEMVDADSPAQPEEGAEMLPIHEARSSSQSSLRVASASAPAFSMNSGFERLPLSQHLERTLLDKSPLDDNAHVRAEFLDDLQHVRGQEDSRAARRRSL